ncbi:MAG: preprotein translocase subunit, partial [Caulobacteraceae bacterium]|nr:preprotein translocase subunit [Caulobacteraceae bacterium]
QAARARAAAAAPAATGNPAATPIQPNLSRPAALALSPRIQIDTPYLRGSLALRGARVDDLFLKNYRETVDKTSPQVELLRPEGMTQAYFAEQGWLGANLPGIPTPQTVWTQTAGGVLSPGHPVVLSYAAPGGLAFTRRIAIDDKAMFTITDSVANRGSAPVTVAPYVSVQRQGLPAGLAKSNIVHEGAIGVLGLDKPELRLANYQSWKKKGEFDWQSRGGWFGITDKYWMTSFVPVQSEAIAAKARVTTDAATGIDIYETSYSGAGRVVAPGQQTTEVSHLFTGAKTVPMLNAYSASLGIPRFVDSVDWGNLWFLTKPIFTLLEFFYQQVGNFGVAILMLTVVIRLITFPLANKGFEMGVKMKKIQPELQAMQKRLKDDPAAQQKEMMALYQREKVNPVTGCLPILFQIPVFYSLTKLFTVTIEMRHAPFFGWIHDLSAPDPTTFLNLFGLIPWDPSMTPLIGGVLGGVLHVGVWPVAYGLSMWLSQSMTPQTGIDPTQQMIFKFMPIMFTFILAQYAVGLLIYWTWSSLITILQQYVMMRRFKVDNPIDEFLRRFSARTEPSG